MPYQSSKLLLHAHSQWRTDGNFFLQASAIQDLFKLKGVELILADPKLQASQASTAECDEHLYVGGFTNKTFEHLLEDAPKLALLFLDPKAIKISEKFLHKVHRVYTAGSAYAFWQGCGLKGCPEASVQSVHIPCWEHMYAGSFACSFNADADFDLVYAGTKRNAKRTKLVQKYFGKPDAPTLIVGDVPLSPAPLLEQIGRQPVASVKQHLARAKATIYIGDTDYEVLLPYAHRLMESISSGLAVFMPLELDPLRKAFPEIPEAYFADRAELADRLSNVSLLAQLHKKQSARMQALYEQSMQAWLSLRL